MSIERRFDVSLVAEMALREKQIQQNYRPIIGVQKWFARRPGTVFRGLLLAENRRHPKNVLVCRACGDLAEVEDRGNPGHCASCASALRRSGPARRGRCKCPRCGHSNAYPGQARGPLGHRLFAIEYHNPHRKAGHRGRFFKKPDEDDLARANDASKRWAKLSPRFVPDQTIPPGDETHRLHRWGYERYRELFNPRQLLGLELSCRLIAGVEDSRIRHALATNLSDLLRYQGTDQNPGIQLYTHERRGGGIPLNT